MKLNYREETARMLKALRKAGYDNSQLRREVTLEYCRDSMGHSLCVSVESNPGLSYVVSHSVQQQLISQALSLGYTADNLSFHLEEGEYEDNGYLYVWVMYNTKTTDVDYYYQVLNLYKESKLQSEQEAMKQEVESLLGCKITTYTINQLKNTLGKYNKD